MQVITVTLEISLEYHQGDLERFIQTNLRQAISECVKEETDDDTVHTDIISIEQD